MSKRVMTEEAYAAHQATVRQLPTYTVPLSAIQPKPRKYRNVPALVDGIKFDSKHEAECWEELKLRERIGDVRFLNRQVSFPLCVDGRVIQRWRCDFFYHERAPAAFSGAVTWRVVVADAKSDFTRKLQSWRRTKALFESLYGIQVTEL